MIRSDHRARFGRTRPGPIFRRGSILSLRRTARSVVSPRLGTIVLPNRLKSLRAWVFAKELGSNYGIKNGIRRPRP